MEGGDRRGSKRNPKGEVTVFNDGASYLSDLYEVNLNYRSTTYDFEINASVVGGLLDFGGTDIVRQQRIELARRMLILPAAYAPLISDGGSADITDLHMKWCNWCFRP